MKRKPAIIAFMAALCLAFTASVFWKSPLDLSHDEEPSNRMAMPPKSVMGNISTRHQMVNLSRLLMSQWSRHAQLLHDHRQPSMSVIWD